MDFNAKLIDTVSNHEPLYNQYLPDHKNRDRIDQHWKEVAAELGSSGNAIFVQTLTEGGRNGVSFHFILNSKTIIFAISIIAL